MNRDELKQEVLNFNRRAVLCNEGTTPLRHTGTKEDLVARLLKASARSLYSTTDGGIKSYQDGGNEASDDSVEHVPKNVRGTKNVRRAVKSTAARRQSSENTVQHNTVGVAEAAVTTRSSVTGASSVGLMELSDEDSDGASDSSEAARKARQAPTARTRGGSRVIRVTRGAVKADLPELAEDSASSEGSWPDDDGSVGSEEEGVFSDGESLVEGEAVEVPAPEDFGSGNPSGDLSGDPSGSDAESSEGEGSSIRSQESDRSVAHGGGDSVTEMEVEAAQGVVVRATARSSVRSAGSGGSGRGRDEAPPVRVGRRTTCRVVLSDDDGEGNSSRSDYEDHSGGEEVMGESEEEGERSDSSASIVKAKRARTSSGRTSRHSAERISSRSTTATAATTEVVTKSQPRAKSATTGSEFESLDELEILLRRHFGFDAFRPGQRYAPVLDM